MAGTREGGLKAKRTNLKNHGKDYYKRIGRLGGMVTGTMGGFVANPELARIAGRKGGVISGYIRRQKRIQRENSK